MQLQIDLLRFEKETAVCNLYTGERCIKIIMTKTDAEALRRDGFFTRKNHEIDSAGVINTTMEYAAIEYKEGHVQLAK